MATTTGVFIPTRYAIILIVTLLWMSAVQIQDLTASYPQVVQHKHEGGETSHHYVESKPVLRNPQDHGVCRFYLAESAVAKNSGMGIFSAVGLHPGDQISFPDLCIFVAEPPQHWTHLHSHTWGWGTYFGQYEGLHSRAACEGIHTTYNTMPDHMINTRIQSPVQPTTAGVRRQTTPAAGAISHHYGIRSEAITTVEAGGELTIYYGDWEFDTKAGPLSKPRRTVSDLETNGWCIDHVEIKQSNIEGAGRGLFTKRRLPAGTTVVPAPLQVFEDRSIFPRPNGQEQLFINYCLQPPNSNMMVYPYGPGCNLINHSRNPNVGLRWSDKNLHHGEFLLLENASEFFKKGWPGTLVLEFYALRDLQAGEEILLDYGDAWQAAWDEHVANWTPPPGAEDYVYPEDMDNAAQLLTVEEQKEKPYPKSIMTMCFTPEFDDEREAKHIQWYDPEWVWGQSNMNYCHILERKVGEDGADRYDVEIIYFDYKKAKPLTEKDLTYDPNKPMEDRYIDYNVPRSAIKWNEKPYNDDEHLGAAFRHPIELPAHLWPEGWGNA